MPSTTEAKHQAPAKYTTTTLPSAGCTEARQRAVASSVNVRVPVQLV